MPPLSPDDFPAFFEAVHGHPPFPWQARLLREVHAAGRWPDMLDVPTGAGKTAAIDVAVFHLALTAGSGIVRAAAMRIAFVVDRRLVVDEAFDRATRLTGHLAAPDARIVETVAKRLHGLAGTSTPLVVERLRGGVPLEDDWARSPCQPTVLCSTVHQVGSRLLFRGYGVSDSMKPVHAGLLGSDALILLDEAHLSQPFRQTARGIATERTLRGADTGPFGVALLTATPGRPDPEEWRFQLGPDDRATPTLMRRLGAAKPVSLQEGADDDEARGRALAETALALLAKARASGIEAPVIGIVANRVRRARAAFAAVKPHHAAKLVIGRARAVDRDRIAAELAPIKTGAIRPTAPLIVVGTQTLEAGADLDLDGLVTEAAPLDALRQRFGRVDRAGRGLVLGGVILAQRKRPPADPIYGIAAAATVSALFPNEGETVDFGIDAMDARLVGVPLDGLLAPKADAPVLMPAYVDLWTHTTPVPIADPDSALFLHGPEREPASVQLVWRADVTKAMEPASLRDLLGVAPPRAAEALELPVWAARQWLAGGKPDLADVGQAEAAVGAGVARQAFRWRGQDDPRTGFVKPGDVIPGDVLVVPSDCGGCDEFGWDPDHTDPVRDVFDEASAPYDGRRFVVRIAPGLIRQALQEEDPDAPVDDRLAEVRTALDRLGPAPTAGAVVEALKDIKLGALTDRLTRLGATRERPLFPYGAETRPGVVLIAPRNAGLPQWIASTETDAAASMLGRAQTIEDHTAAVVALAHRFAAAAGLPAAVEADLVLAAGLHDAGKTDLRFQRLLAEADPFAGAAGAAVLAKSAKGRSPPGAWARTRLPPHWRHEALSVRLALTNPRLQAAHDRALVLWLIGSHHGQGRPFFPHEDPAEAGGLPLAAVAGLAPRHIDAGQGPQTLAFSIEGAAFGPTARDVHDLRGLDWSGLFVLLKDRYGPWGLARMEAVLRLADHRASEAVA